MSNPDVYVGTLGAARNDELIETLDPDHVVTLTPTTVPATTDHHPLRDGLNNQQVFNRAVTAVKDAIEAAECVLVHCRAGVSRSTGVLATALAAEHGQSFDEALALVQDARQKADPTPPIRWHARDYLGTATIEEKVEESMYSVSPEAVTADPSDNSELVVDDVPSHAAEDGDGSAILESDLDDVMESFDE